MSSPIQCPKCAGSLSSYQRDHRQTHICNRCGPMPFRDGLDPDGTVRAMRSVAQLKEDLSE